MSEDKLVSWIESGPSILNESTIVAKGIELGMDRAASMGTWAAYEKGLQLDLFGEEPTMKDLNVSASVDVHNLWNALSEAIDALGKDLPHLPEDVSAERQSEIEKLKQVLDGGKQMMFKHSSKEK